MKLRHTYLAKPDSVSFTIKVGDKLLEECKELHSIGEKFIKLRELVKEKRLLVGALYEELNIYTNIAKMNPTTANIEKVKELADSLLKIQGR